MAIQTVWSLTDSVPSRAICGIQNNNKLRMKHLSFTLLAIIGVLLSGCTKEIIGAQGEVIATKVVTAEAGSFTAAIHTYGVWQAVAECDWLHVDSEYKKGEYAITIHYDSNESSETKRRFNRTGCVVIKTYDGYTADTIRVQQMGLVPIINLQNAEVAAEGGKVIVPLNTNLSDEVRDAIKCSANAEWVQDVQFGYDATSVIANVKANGGSQRECSITMSFTDGWGQVTNSTCTLIQLQKE